MTLALAACGIPSTEERRLTAQRVAEPAGLTATTLTAGGFQHAGYFRARAPGGTLRVYLEGDGFAWVSSIEISPDPTPIEPVLLRLAAADDAPNLAYLARPCQYTRFTDPRCNPFYWAGARKYGEEIVAAIDAAVSDLARRARAERVELIGYSGGGAIAVLLAARRTDVASVRTIAGNLDHVWLHDYHRVSQLTESLNAIDAAPRLARLPQLHLAGAGDRIVPPDVAQRYVRASGSGSCARARVVGGATHIAGWQAVWRELLADTPRCP